MRKVRYETLALAIGAYVTAELAVCMEHPALLMLEGEQRVWCNPEMRAFDMPQFEQHLVGLLSDLVDICGPGHDYAGPVMLVFADEMSAGVDWQQCASGFARIEVAA